MTADTPESSRKEKIDALLLKLSGLSARKINDLEPTSSATGCSPASLAGIGLRLSAATATELYFSRDNVVPFQPLGLPSTREWIQNERADTGDYEKDLEIFQASLEFVQSARNR